jgi:hypothetical protein
MFFYNAAVDGFVNYTFVCARGPTFSAEMRRINIDNYFGTLSLSEGDPSEEKRDRD